MGLDITAYSRLEKIDAVFDASGEPIDPVSREPLDWKQFRQLHVNPDFPQRADGIEDRAVYKIGGEQLGFRAGSYGGYGAWRKALARMAGYTPEQAWRGEAEGQPFADLVNFSDCEGVIGPITSAKLARDFAEWDDRAKRHDLLDPSFYDRYHFWRRAFELASDAGAVDFH